jgi:quinol-cytochrome oxidoreductase complex cytochrome b subunit/coenzyme F420-reducing hydrogenase delta subunit
MFSHVSRTCRALFYFVEARFNSAFGQYNPFYHLGSLGFYFFYIMLVSGTYLFFYYEPTVSGSFEQLQWLSREQWYLGGVMRSLHRYAADGMVLAMTLHLLRELVMGRFRGSRWFSWITGTPILMMTFLCGIIGFWLVWDKLGQFVAVRTSEWLDWLPIFASPMARNFLHNSDITDLLFRLLIVMHLSIPVFLFAGMLVHIKRISRAQVLPPRMLALGTLAALLLLSLLQPVVSHESADLRIASSNLNLDWFYLFLYPLINAESTGMLWGIFAVGILLLLLVPWLPSPPKSSPVAAVNPDHCSGCGLCAVDCPYEAIKMRDRSDAHPYFLQQASVIASNCVHCGICTGSCPSSNPFRHATALPFGHVNALKSGIEMPQWNVDVLRHQVDCAVADSAADTILLIGCEHSFDIHTLGMNGVVQVTIPCIGMLPPAFIEYALHKGAAGVLLNGCRKGDCFHRFGGKWLRHRLSNERRPYLRHSVDRSSIALCWTSISDGQELQHAVDTLRRRVPDH